MSVVTVNPSGSKKNGYLFIDMLSKQSVACMQKAISELNTSAQFQVSTQLKLQAQIFVGDSESHLV
ncbi:hypothetical protein Plhal304r1_c028g0092691 [Plasmopara halstedii]